MNVHRDQRSGSILDGLSIGYLLHVLIALALERQQAASVGILASWIASRVAGASIFAHRDALGVGTRRLPSWLNVAIQATCIINTLAVGWLFLKEAGILPGTILGMPASFFFLPEFMFSMVLLVVIERSIAALVITLRESAARKVPVQKMLKCNAEARSMRPS